MSRHFSTFYGGRITPMSFVTPLKEDKIISDCEDGEDDESSDEINEQTIIQNAQNKEPFATSEVRKHFKDLVKNMGETEA